MEDPTRLVQNLLRDEADRAIGTGAEAAAYADACSRLASQAHLDLLRERVAQDEEHGGPQHDDGHTPEQWTDFIQQHLVRAKPFGTSVYRKQLIRVAALAIAAVESLDRHVKRSAEAFKT